MAITSSDLFFVESERMIDNLSTDPAIGGGGDMGFAIAQDAVENNIFPDVMPGDRVSGRVQLRKVYASVLSADNDALANPQVGLLERPSDPNVEVCVFSSEVPSSTVDQSFISSSADDKLAFSATSNNYGASASGHTGNTFTGCSPDPTLQFAVGDLVSASDNSGLPSTCFYRKVTAVTASTLTVEGPAFSLSVGIDLYKHRTRFSEGYAISGLSLTTVLAAAGATQMTLDRIDVQVSPPSMPIGESTSYLRAYPGRQLLYVDGDQLLLQHPTVPATRELITVSRVNYIDNVVTFTTPTVNEYPVGSKVTRPVPVPRTIQANVSVAPFAQQAWTRTWSDAIIGSAITARYSGAIGLKNGGASNDRWAVIFVSSTQFDIFSERLGKVGNGNIGVNTTPLNPLTNQPYFTLYSAGWGSGWVVGNVVRFNTRAAAAPIWISRCVVPGTASGDDSMSLFMRGDVDA